MDHTTVGGMEDRQLPPWAVSVSHASASYQGRSVPDGSSFIITPSSSEEPLSTQYTTLSALQGSFISIQPSSHAADYQTLQHGAVEYQPVYISGGSFEGISSDGDFVVTAGDDEGVASSLRMLNTGRTAVQLSNQVGNSDFVIFIFVHST